MLSTNAAVPKLACWYRYYCGKYIYRTRIADINLRKNNETFL